MSPFHCTPENLDEASLDKAPFKFAHRLVGHPALELTNLERVIPRLPKSDVFYSSGLLRREDDFDRAHIEHRNGLSIEQTVEQLKVSNSYVMVRAPERDPSFAPLFRELLGDVNALSRRRGLGSCDEGAMLYLFLASPKSLTPFHFDRYSTFLFQFRGSKKVWVAPPWDPRVISPADNEAFMARTGVRPVWQPHMEALGRGFDFATGEALHIPFASGHYVENGADDVSVSMSIIFNTRQTRAQSRALILNHALRKRGLAPAPVGASVWRDQAKAAAMSALEGVQGVRAAARKYVASRARPVQVPAAPPAMASHVASIVASNVPPSLGAARPENDVAVPQRRAG